MKIGTPVWLTRGSMNRNPSFGPGFGREVMGTLVGVEGNQVQVRLDQDDPNSGVGGPFFKGEIGWWSKSAIKAR